MKFLSLIALVFITDTLAAQDTDPPDYFDPARFEADIVAFERADSVEGYIDDAVLFYGSSSIRMWHDSLASDMAPFPVIPRGFGGSTMIDALTYADRVVIPRKPKAIFLYEGDNDVGHYGVSPERVTELFKALVARVHRALPETEIYFLAIKPSPSRWEHWPAMAETNTMIREICESDVRLHYVDVATPMLNEDGTPNEEIFLEDMLHMNRDGYLIWKSVVRDALSDARLD